MKRLLAALLPLALLFQPAFAATLPATPATLWNQMGAAQPGDHVQLQSGDYGDIPAWNFKKAGVVTIEPAPGAVVTLSSINADGSTNLLITGFDVAMKATTQYGITAGSGANNVVYDRMKVHQADASLLQGVGFWFRNAIKVTVQNSEFYWLGTGGGALDSDQVLIAGNRIHDINVDGILLSGKLSGVVSGNTLRDFHPGAGDHPDGIQFFDAASGVVGPLEISSNRIERGSVGQLQGIFGEGGAGISIHDNELLGTMYNGIGLARTKVASIDHNFVDGYPDMDTRIIVRGGCDSVALTNNTTQSVFSYVTTGEPPCTNVTLAGNTIIPASAGAGDYAALNAWKGTTATPVVTPPVVSPPVVTPPAVNPLQATVDSLNAKVASLTAQLAAAAKLAQTVQTAVTAVQRPLTDLKAALK